MSGASLYNKLLQKALKSVSQSSVKPVTPSEVESMLHIACTNSLHYTSLKYESVFFYNVLNFCDPPDANITERCKRSVLFMSMEKAAQRAQDRGRHEFYAAVQSRKDVYLCV